MELEQAKEVVANMATREPAVYTKREQTSSWNRIYELAGETNYIRNGIIISNTESVKLEYWDGESIDLSGLVVKYTGDNSYTEAVEKAELDDVCENWQSETSTARIESDDNVVDNKVTKMITISATENPSWTAEVEITVKRVVPTRIDALSFTNYTDYPVSKVYVYQNTKIFYYIDDNGDVEGVSIKYELDWSSGSTDSSYTIATDDMISVDTSALGETTVTVTYTDPASGVSVSGTLNVEVTKNIAIPITASSYGCGVYLMEVASGYPLPEGVTYSNGELLYNGEPIYINRDTNGEGGISIRNDTNGDGVYDSPSYEEISALNMVALPVSHISSSGWNFNSDIYKKSIYTIQPDESYGENGITGTYKYFKYTDTGLKLMVVR